MAKSNQSKRTKKFLTHLGTTGRRCFEASPPTPAMPRCHAAASSPSFAWRARTARSGSSLLTQGAYSPPPTPQCALDSATSAAGMNHRPPGHLHSPDRPMRRYHHLPLLPILLLLLLYLPLRPLPPLSPSVAFRDLASAASSTPSSSYHPFPSSSSCSRCDSTPSWPYLLAVAW